MSLSNQWTCFTDEEEKKKKKKKLKCWKKIAFFLKTLVWILDSRDPNPYEHPKSDCRKTN